MGEAEEGGPPPRYRAFISYSHADTGFAFALHRKLERWKPPGGQRLTPIFIDRAELAAGPDLSAQVEDALEASAALIVVASPAARRSQWVRQEIGLFRTACPGRPILVALHAGEPAEAFPDLLLHGPDKALEPLAADFRKGGDGERLALLKLAAGLTAQPLDRLVQRDAQARQRRVMWITAGALLLSLVLAALLVMALRARAEAQRQRAEAEGLVEFMLTDLRDKLKGVGRLDVMDAVNERAMAHYAKEEPSALPDDAGLRRAKLLLAMGEDDLDREGARQRGVEEVGTAYRITSELLHRDPNDPARLFQHAQSEYWMGFVAFSDRSRQAFGQQRDFDGSRRHWNEYAALADRLVALAPRDPGSFKERAYARGALCGLQLEQRSDTASAIANCKGARLALEQAIALNPADTSLQLDLANRLAWEAEALAGGGQWPQALDQRRRQVAITEQAVARNPRDAEVVEADMLAQMGMAKLLEQMGRRTEADQTLRKALALSGLLVERDPANRNWAGWRRQIQEKLAH